MLEGLLVEDFHEAVIRVAMHRLVLKLPLQPRELSKLKAFLTVELPKALPPGIIRTSATPKKNRASPAKEPAAQLSHFQVSPDLLALEDVEPLNLAYAASF
jgi:hypothetical protein